jgi:hypothetical protein
VVSNAQFRERHFLFEVADFAHGDIRQQLRELAERAVRL